MIYGSKKILSWLTIHSFILLAVLQKVHSRFQNEFSGESDLMLPVSFYSTLFFLKVIQ
jgi:hypothetical protein